MRDNLLDAPLDEQGGELPTWNPDRLSQQANAERLIVELKGDARFNTTSKSWMYFSGGRFSPDATMEVQKCAKRVARQTWSFTQHPPSNVDRQAAFRHALESERASGINGMIKLAESEPGIATPHTAFDRDKLSFNVLNGTIDLRTRQLRPHRREDLLSKVAPVVYNPEATCDRWDAFINRSTAGSNELMRYLARIAGKCLSGIPDVEELYIFHGDGANGKSKFLDTLMGLMGDYATNAADSLLTSRASGEHPTDVAQLCGRRLVVASETEKDTQLKLKLLKRLTGDKYLTARFMHQDSFEFERTHTLILVTNNRPKIPEDTNAIWRRVKLVPFSVTIPESERDINLLQKLEAERSGILNWCLKGYADFIANGIQTPDIVNEASAEYRRSQDGLKQFLDSECILAPGQKVLNSRLYDAYCQSGGAEKLGKTAFYEAMRKRFGEEKQMRFGEGGVTRGLFFCDIGLRQAMSIAA